MKRSEDLLGTPVISAEEGIEVGQVKGLLINVSTAQTAGIAVAGRSLFDAPKVAPFALIQGFGADVVVIENTSSMAEPSSLPELESLVRSDGDIKGMKVVTRDGRFVGTVDALFIDLPSGKVTGYGLQVPGGTRILPADLVITIGKQFIVAATNAGNRLIDTANFSAASSMPDSRCFGKAEGNQ
ncbi:MAG: PRC-barrel domain-containing protein [Firmicutes bacterium]|jgi:uncharacterized protein YrrD|nr:PRC-barrel domain-containing protein [Bacillota bacterium]